MADSLLGKQLANYLIERKIGQGGMAQVYFGHDVTLQRPVALKVIDARFRGDPDYARRFLQEARTMASWRHENIIQVYYAAEEDGIYYFTMEYVDGLNLAELFEQYSNDGELMSHEDVLRIIRKVASALDYAHARGIIHRDIKPSNILIARDNRVLLADFGLALDMEQGSLGQTFGTAHYIAPEQAIQSADAVPQSDLYSLGVILYEMLTGTVPFDAETYTGVVMQHLAEPPRLPRSINPDLTPQLEAVLLKILAKTPEERYQSGADLVEALEDAMLQITPLPHSSKYELPPVPASVVRDNTPRNVSSLSVADRIAAFDHVRPTAPNQHATPQPHPTPTVTAPGRDMTASPSRRLPLIPVIGIVTLLALLGGGYLLLSGRDDEPDKAESPTATQAAVVIDATATLTVPATGEATAAPAIVATTAATSATTEPTQQPTVEATTAPTDVPQQAAQQTIAPTEAPQSGPTAAYPDGYRIRLFYDAASLYVYNTGERSYPIGELSFAAINSSGQPTGRQFEGSRWVGVSRYGAVDPRSCVAMQMNGQTWLRPPQCRSYNAFVNPSPTDDIVFWTPLDDATHFEVRWGNTVVAKCAVTGGEERGCAFNLP